MSDNIFSQYEFFQNVQLDADGNLLVKIVNFTGGTGGDNYYTTGVTLDGNVLVFDRNDLLSAYTVDLSAITVSGDYLPLSGGTINGNLVVTGITSSFIYETNIDCGTSSSIYNNIVDGGSGSTLDFEYNLNAGFVGRAPFPDKSTPYRIDRTAIGATYTFSDNLNVLSIEDLTQNSEVILPENPNYTSYIVKDKSGKAGIYPITVTAGRRTINNNENFIINLDTKPSITFLWDGSDFITI
jgi:hypothetical protein